MIKPKFNGIAALAAGRSWSLATLPSFVKILRSPSLSSFFDNGLHLRATFTLTASPVDGIVAPFVTGSRCERSGRRGSGSRLPFCALPCVRAGAGARLSFARRCSALRSALCRLAQARLVSAFPSYPAFPAGPSLRAAYDDVLSQLLTSVFTCR